MSNPSEILDAQINAGWKHAAAYDGDDRQDIKSDVFNAFQAGVVWERRRALEGRPSLEMAPIAVLAEIVSVQADTMQWDGTPAQHEALTKRPAIYECRWPECSCASKVCGG